MRALLKILDNLAGCIGWVVIVVTLLQAVGVIDVLLWIGPSESVQVNKQPVKVWT